MPKITLVEPQKKNLPAKRQISHRFNIYIDGQFVFGADEDLVVDQRLIVGKEVSENDLEGLLYEAEVGKLMESIYALFNKRQRSTKEVKNYLRKLSYKRKVNGQCEISSSAIDLVVEKLKHKNLLDDEEFARSWVYIRRKSKKIGKIALRVELIRKGIDKEIIDKVLEEACDLDTEEAIAHKALAKRLPRWSSLSYLTQKRKAYEYLGRHGFEYNIIKDVVEKVIKNVYTRV